LTESADPTKEGQFGGNFHVVFTDGNFVFDPGWSETPVHLEKWYDELSTTAPPEMIFYGKREFGTRRVLYPW
jgi:hypothetical protein